MELVPLRRVGACVVFSQITYCKHASLSERFFIRGVDDYKFLKHGGKLTIPGVDDATEFTSTIKSLKFMGLSGEEIECK